MATNQPSSFALAGQKGIGVLGLFKRMPRELEGRIQECWENIKNAKPVGAPINNQTAVVAFAQCQENKKRALEVDGGRIGWDYGLSRVVD